MTPASRHRAATSRDRTRRRTATPPTRRRAATPPTRRRAATPPTRRRAVTPPPDRGLPAGRPGRLRRRDRRGVPQHVQLPWPRLTVRVLVVHPVRGARLGGRTDPRPHL